jgi:type I restriction enzyme S subunit
MPASSNTFSSPSRSAFKVWGKGVPRPTSIWARLKTNGFPFPPVPEQKQIVSILDAVREETQRLESTYQRKLVALEDLKKSLLHWAFTGNI